MSYFVPYPGDTPSKSAPSYLESGDRRQLLASLGCIWQQLARRFRSRTRSQSKTMAANGVFWLQVAAVTAILVNSYT